MQCNQEASRQHSVAATRYPLSFLPQAERVLGLESPTKPQLLPPRNWGYLDPCVHIRVCPNFEYAKLLAVAQPAQVCDRL